jgi:hypothetical protein
MEAMNRLLIPILILFYSCGSGNTNNVDTPSCYECVSDLKKYENFSFKYINKEILDIISNDTIYKADIIIDVSRKDSISYILIDSVLCYCLSICKNEMITEARFYKDYEGYNIATENNLTNFSRDNIISKVNGNIDWITKHIICSFKINQADKSWNDKVSSDNLFIPTYRKISTKWDKNGAPILRVK